ncbi:MAG: DUF2141 domain-containing protein [Alphaproteobacteria bacterium]|jgi:uncharacterized protein (DUF2141 family)|nr:DUF2141 domain-containing protein [Alphaproteobacteria bacterium]
MKVFNNKSRHTRPQVPLVSIFIYIFFTIFSVALYANNTATLNISVKDVDSKTGIMYLALCDRDVFLQEENKRDYTKCPATATKQISAGESYNFVFKNIPFGDYAIFGYIDENLNGKIDYNDMGIPKEPVIFIARLKREPTFEDIKLIVQQETQSVVLIAQ